MSLFTFYRHLIYFLIANSIIGIGVSLIAVFNGKMLDLLWIGFHAVMIWYWVTHSVEYVVIQKIKREKEEKQHGRP